MDVCCTKMSCLSAKWWFHAWTIAMSSPAFSVEAPAKPLLRHNFHHEETLVNPSMTPGFAPGRVSKFPGSGWVESVSSAPNFHAPSVSPGLTRRPWCLASLWKLVAMNFSAEGMQRAQQDDQGGHHPIYKYISVYHSK